MSDAPALAVHRPEPPPGSDRSDGEEPGLRLDLGLYAGPLDLLHHLARRSEVDVRELPVAEVARQFDRFSRALTYVDLEGAGDFLAAASHLLEMKSQRAVPAPPKRKKVERTADRTALLARLLEYRRYKEAAAELERRAAGASERLPRIAPKPERDGGGIDRIRDVELWDLVGALARVLEPAEEVGAGTLKREDVPVAEWVQILADRVRAEGRVRFLDCFADPTDRSAVAGAFLAVLELLRHHGFRATQADAFGGIVLEPPPRSRNAEARPGLGVTPRP